MIDPTPWLDTETGARFADLNDAPPGSFTHSPRTEHDQEQQ